MFNLEDLEDKNNYETIHKIKKKKHYMAALGYKFYLLMQKVSLTHLLHSLVRDT